MDERYDVIVAGAGLIGLATAYAVLQARPGTRLAVLEKEPAVASHQSGRNSGVIHSGLYYRPGSAKASYAVRGAEATLRFCAEHDVPARRTGKLVVAVTPAELPALGVLEERGGANGVPVRRLDAAEAKEFEPDVACVAALHVASTGVCDYPAMARALAAEIARLGGSVRLATPLTGLHAAGGDLTVTTTTEVLRTRVLVNCAGLQADRVARLQPGADVPVRIVPFRGEYAELGPAAAARVRGLVYPVPDPALPFLGVHLTRGVDGVVHAGPNAVPALAREGYSWGRVSAAELADTLAWPGAWRLARGYARTGVAEVRRSLSKRRFAAEVARLLPGVTAADLRPAPAGVRAQAVDRQGRLVDDFLVVEHGPAVHVLNAPSPAATACLPIGEDVARRALARLTAG